MAEETTKGGHAIQVELVFDDLTLFCPKDFQISKLDPSTCVAISYTIRPFKQTIVFFYTIRPFKRTPRRKVG